MSAKQWCVEMSWGWSLLEVPKNADDFVSIRAALKAKRVRACGAVTSTSYPVNVETRRLSCSRKAMGQHVAPSKRVPYKPHKTRGRANATPGAGTLAREARKRALAVLEALRKEEEGR